jgi:hypothetical protein
MTGFRGGSAGTLTDIIALSGTTTLETGDEEGEIGHASNIAGTVRAATAENDTFATGFNGRDAIVAIVGADLERGVPEWNVSAGTGEFTGSFIITL